MSFALRHPAGRLRRRRDGRELLDTYMRAHAHATAVYVRQNWREDGMKKQGGMDSDREVRKGKARGRKVGSRAGAGKEGTGDRTIRLDA